MRPSRSDVTDVAVIGSIGFLRTERAIYLVHMSRFPLLSHVDAYRIFEMDRVGWTDREIAPMFDVSPAVVQHALSRERKRRCVNP